MKNKEIKRGALSKLKGNWGKAIGGFLVFSVIISVIAYIGNIPLGIALFRDIRSAGVSLIGMSLVDFYTPLDLLDVFGFGNPIFILIFIFLGVFSLFVVFVFPAFYLGFYRFFLEASREKSFKIKNIFSGFKDSWGKSILIYILMNIYLLLWNLLFIIPAIIKSFSYSMTFYILIDNPDISANEAITRSRKMMKGYKWKLFCLYLSFIGWYILSMLSLGIGFIWLVPYVESSVAEFYLYVSSEYEAN